MTPSQPGRRGGVAVTSANQRYGEGVHTGLSFNSLRPAVYAVSAQVDEGSVEVVNLRETDGRLGPLILALVILGAVTLCATAMYWWATRPTPALAAETPIGDNDG